MGRIIYHVCVSVGVVCVCVCTSEVLMAHESTYSLNQQTYNREPRERESLQKKRNNHLRFLQLYKLKSKQTQPIRYDVMRCDTNQSDTKRCDPNGMSTFGHKYRLPENTF